MLVSTVIDRPQADVFGYVTDLRHDVHWYRGIVAVDVLSEVDVGVGVVYQQVTSLFGRTFTATMKVTSYDPPRHMTLASIRSLTPFLAHYHFRPTAVGAGTVFTLDAEVTGVGAFRLLGPLFVPLVRRATMRRLRILKKVLEA